MKKLLKITVLLMAVLMLFAACGGNSEDETTTAPSKEILTQPETTISNFPVTTEPVYDLNHHFVKFTMADGGIFVVETYPEYAPATCQNFVSLVTAGFYDGKTIHRVEDSLVQGGAPKTEELDPIKGEFASNGFAKNTLKHEKGVISMARTMHPNSATSQFFICYEAIPYLDGDYAAFGKVIEGMETVETFKNAETEEQGNLSIVIDPIVIEKAEVIS